MAKVVFTPNIQRHVPCPETHAAVESATAGEFGVTCHGYHVALRQPVIGVADRSDGRTALVGDQQIDLLERAIEKLEAGLPPLRNFILPAGSRGAALLHVARGVCRRAERRVVTLSHSGAAAVSPRIIRYLNRLGDYLFVAARFANWDAGLGEKLWQTPAQ